LDGDDGEKATNFENKGLIYFKKKQPNINIYLSNLRFISSRKQLKLGA